MISGCADLAPKYDVPAVDTPVAFKEGQGSWIRAAPADALSRGPWWALFEDPVLDGLVSQVAVTNQNVAAAAAAYAQARALTREQRAPLFPAVDLGSSANRSGAGGGGGAHGSYQVNIGASWEPDVWGRIANTVASARGNEQASAADLAAATLSAQGELAVDYFGLREADLLHASQAETVKGYERSLTITRNRYNVGVAARTDVLQAESQLATAQADLIALERTRAQFEHGIAVLIGKAPADFTLAADANWRPRVPGIPLELPSTLLQRRPDIAAAERRVYAANARIGVERAGYYPDIRLSASAGLAAAHIGDLFKSSSLVWSLGATLAQTIFDAGATSARVDEARAGMEEAAARYRQTVLSAFEDVENQLVALRVLQQQVSLRQQAFDAAVLVEQQVLNRYRSGLVSYTEVVTAQATSASARRALVQVQNDREVAAVSLIQALGGGWKGMQ
ncbi:MAG TPA: efflux transporter outer membrane subunit [Ramlibacter sp.]|uniref:efflux transporter outer membrane subunit n=1 Tax=Ramlibacter sp. TaxID=1917967 RepID=UPI002B8C13D5|nr:efflux transporter outer membrane subunit [Ramlibacter sp.]HVZ44716.1 efflux transporter outer membrane subunit [Ramlibacter sp.]